MTEKVRGRSRKRKFNSIRRVTDKLKRCAVWLVCISLIGTSIPMSMILASAEDEEDEIVSECEIFSMSLDSLLESTEKAVKDEEPLSEEIYEFSGSNAERYEKLLDTKDGLLYEVYPVLDEEGDSLNLRTFVRLKKSGLEEVSAETDKAEGDQLSYYNATGDEEIIFLLINDTDSEVSARIQVRTDEETYETQLIKVPGYHESITLDETSVTTPLDYVTVDEKDENVQTAALRIESGSNAFWEDEEEPEDETEAGNWTEETAEAEEEPETETEAETDLEAEILEEAVSVGTGSTVTGSNNALVIEAVETASNALINTHSEGCVSMHGTLYDAVTVDNGHAVAFSTTFADLGYDSDDTDDIEWITYTAYADGVAVTVKLPAGAVPEDAELSVEVYDDDSSEHEDILSLMAKEVKVLKVETDSDAAVIGLGNEETVSEKDITMNISFLADGEEVEPSETAYVQIDASELLEDEGMENFEVYHIEDGEPVPVFEQYGSTDGTAEFSVESFSYFYLHLNSSGGGWAGLGINLLDQSGNSISGSFSKDGFSYSGGVATGTVDMPYEIDTKSLAEEDITGLDSYTFSYATLTDPNYGDTTHYLDPEETNVGVKDVYGSEDDPIISVTVYEAHAADSSYGQVSKTWGYTITYESGLSDYILIYGNASGGNDNGGLYCPIRPELNLYYTGPVFMVLNLGNGNGTYSDGDYTGSNASGGEALRYTTGDLSEYEEDGKVTVNLPSDNDLDQEFTVVNAVGTEGEDGYQPAMTIGLGREEAYDYKLVGWINIATGEYYDVSSGSVTAEIYLSNNNVFYADWVAASYDHGSAEDDGLRDDIVSTSSFVSFSLYDYNELFNLYSVTLEQSGTDGESWTDSESFYSEPLLSKDKDTLEDRKIADSFIFQNNGTTRSSAHVLAHANPARWNLWTANTAWDGMDEYNFVLDAGKYWNITSPDSTILGMLYDKDEKSLGVHYVGEGDYLFRIDDDGYYIYDSKVSGAAYNQTDERFYVYEDNNNAFFPYNDHTEGRTSSNGLTDYWFGMSMDVRFYLPNDTSGGSEGNKVNQVDDKDMVFDFSGDDDIMIFIDGKMVCDMSGIHSNSYSRINFSTNTVTISMKWDDDNDAPDTSDYDAHKYSERNDLNLKAGNHTLTVRYMERGASESNLKIRFNVGSQWDYESGMVQTVRAEKTWTDAQGNEIDPDDLPTTYKVDGVEFGLFDVVGSAEEDSDEDEDTVGYTKNGNTYTVIYTDDSGVKRTYVYDSSGPTLTYTEVDSDGNTLVDSETDDQTDSEGRVVDKDGYVVAWLEEDTDGIERLYIRIDKQTLNNENDWQYAWELLDPEGTYEVLELSESSSYTAMTVSEDIETHEYWAIIGEDEIDASFETGEDLMVILTEAAQEASNTLGNTKDAMGWVIVADSDGSVTAEQAEFSQIAELQEIYNEITGQTSYHTIAGVTSRSEIDELGDGAVWYVEDADSTYIDISGEEMEEFYLYCILDGTNYYLTVQGKDPEYELAVTSDKDSAGLFCYDVLGELLVVLEEEDEEGDEDDSTSKQVLKRVEIEPDGTIEIGDAEAKSARDDIRFYTLQEIESIGFTFSAGNTFLPEFTLVKVDSTTNEPLAGVSFTLQNEGGQYYTFDTETDKVVWKEKSEESDESVEGPIIATDEAGEIIFHYLEDGTYALTETATLDGYNILPSSITLTIEDGMITGIESEYMEISDDGITFTVNNTPGTELPETGGPGTFPFYLLGLILSLGSVCLLYTKCQRSHRNA